jgi:hypothetical protein
MRASCADMVSVQFAPGAISYSLSEKRTSVRLRNPIRQLCNLGGRCSTLYADSSSVGSEGARRRTDEQKTAVRAGSETFTQTYNRHSIHQNDHARLREPATSRLAAASAHL